MRGSTRSRAAGWVACAVVVALAAVLIPHESLTPAASATSGAGGDGRAAETASSIPFEFDFRASVAEAEEYESLSTARPRDGRIPAVVGLRISFTASGRLSRTDREAQQAAVAAARRQLTDALAGTDYVVAREWPDLPFVALELSASAIGALRDSGLAASIRPNRSRRPLLEKASKRVEAPEAHYLGWTGKDEAIAVIDTGVESFHPTFDGRVIDGACFSDGDNCPGNTDEAFGLSAGEPCLIPTNDCDHGTGMAGVAAGDKGVAPKAWIVSINVASKHEDDDCPGVPSPCVGFVDSDVVTAVQHVIALDGLHNYSAVNMSLGGTEVPDPSECDPASPYGVAFSNLWSHGIAPVVGAGNNGFKSTISAPACIPQALAVGVVDENDEPHANFDSGPAVDYFAPGTNLLIPKRLGDWTMTSGSSASAAFVSGAITVFRDRVGFGVPLSDITTALSFGGVPVTDPANLITRASLRVLSGLVEYRDTGFGDGPSVEPPAGTHLSSLSAGVGLRRRSGALVIDPLPASAKVVNAWLWWQTMSRPKVAGESPLVWDGIALTGKLVGVANAACEDEHSGPVRTYRANVKALVTGNQTIDIDVAGRPIGASVLIAYTTPYQGQLTKLTIREGARSSSVQGLPMTDWSSFLKNADSGRLHLGVGAGDIWDDPPVKFGWQQVLGEDSFQAADGPSWDDISAPLSGAHLGTGSTATISIPTSFDCRTWAYHATHSAVRDPRRR